MDGSAIVTPVAPASINELVLALSKAQGQLSAAPRNREVAVKTKTGGEYKFKYATLDAIIEHVRKPLTENGLWFTQTLDEVGGRYKLITTLFHSSGQYLTSATPLLVGGGGNQEFGSALTYMRRYALSAILGIAADEDDDANTADGNSITHSSDRKPAQRQQAPADKPQGQARTATPQSNADAAWKQDAERIKREIQGASTVASLDAFIKAETAKLTEIKGHSATAYDHLMKCATQRGAELQQAA